jgi:hypothetical protein
MRQLIVKHFEIWKDVTRTRCTANLYDTRKKTYAPDIITAPSDVTSFISRTFKYIGQAVAQLVEALHYKPKGCGFDFRWCHNPSCRTISASNRNEYQELYLEDKGSLKLRADELITLMCRLS